MSTPRHARVPDLLVEKLHLGELSQADAAAVRARLVETNEVHRLTALASDDGVTDALPVVIRERIARVSERVRERRRGQARSWSLLVTAASLAMMALVVALPPTEATRAKGGGAALVIYRRNAGASDTNHGVEVLADNTVARRGDVLQLAIRADGARLGAVYSLDGRGLITEHLAPRAIVGPAELRLDDGYELDDAPRFERFFLLLGDTLDGQAIRAALANLITAPDPATAPLSVPGARVVSRVLSKGPP